jgi:hypothetical protein
VRVGLPFGEGRPAIWPAEPAGRMAGMWRRRKPRGGSVEDHDRKRLVVAADWAITSARRVAAPDELAVVTVAAVVERARDDFGLIVKRDQAAAVLRERLELRGGGLDVATDA